MSKVIQMRKDVDVNLTWDLTAIFKTEEDYEAAVKKSQELTDEIKKEFKGKLNSAANINACLDQLREFYQLAILTGTYSYLAVAVDQTNVENQSRQMKLANIGSNLESRLSFIDSEIIQVDESIIKEAIKDSKENKGYLEDILRRKKHALHPEVERTLSALSPVLGSP